MFELQPLPTPKAVVHLNDSHLDRKQTQSNSPIESISNSLSNAYHQIVQQLHGCVPATQENDPKGCGTSKINSAGKNRDEDTDRTHKPEGIIGAGGCAAGGGAPPPEDPEKHRNRGDHQFPVSHLHHTTKFHSLKHSSLHMSNSDKDKDNENPDENEVSSDELDAMEADYPDLYSILKTGRHRSDQSEEIQPIDPLVQLLYDLNKQPTSDSSKPFSESDLFWKGANAKYETMIEIHPHLDRSDRVRDCTLGRFCEHTRERELEEDYDLDR